MKSFLYNLFLFVLTAAAGYAVLIFIWGNCVPKRLNKNLLTQFSYGYLEERFEEADAITGVDILILGSSHAYRGYDTRIFKANGIKAFNFGSTAQTPVQCELIAGHYVKQMKPKLVIVDIYPIVFGLDGTESALDIILNQRKLDAAALTLNAIQTKNVKVYNTLLYSAYPNFEKQVAEKSGGTDTYIQGGFVETSKKGSSAENNLKFAYEILPKQIQAFERILQKLKDNNIPFVLVQAPIRKDAYNAVTNNKQMDSLFASYGEYYNFNESLNMGPEFFVDKSHLNQPGVEIYNASLMQKVNKINNLK